MHLQVVIFAIATLVSSRDWRAAENYAAAQREAWSEIWIGFGVDPLLAEAVVFPEMVRYSTFQNVLETAATRALYQQMGSRGADFSIGRFQMKPSFAEHLEREWTGSPSCAEYGIWFDTSDTTESRRARIKRLDDPVWQCAYLGIFLKLLYERHPELASREPADQVRLCAAAYNGGCGAESLETIETMAGRKFFHTDFIVGAKTLYHSYSDIAEYYYKTL
jgi:phage protein U